MSTKPYDPAFSPQAPMGITKREYFAARAMQGLCGSPDYCSETSKKIAEYAVEQADALFAALNKVTENEGKS